MSQIRADGFGMKDEDDDAAYQTLVGDVKRLSQMIRPVYSFMSPAMQDAGVIAGNGDNISSQYMNLPGNTYNGASSSTDGMSGGIANFWQVIANSINNTSNPVGAQSVMLGPNNLSDVSSALSSSLNIGAFPIFGLTAISRTILTGSGSGSLSASCKFATAAIIAGGGGGGGSGSSASSSTSAYPGGCGGGQGETVLAFINVASSGSSSYSYSCGAGGAGASATATASNGANSTFTYNGTTVTACKGGGGSPTIPGFGGRLSTAYNMEMYADEEASDIYVIRFTGRAGDTGSITSLLFTGAGAMSSSTVAGGRGGGYGTSTTGMQVVSYGNGGNGGAFSVAGTSGVDGAILLTQYS